MRAGALVLGASYRSLGVVRSLGRHGIPVRVVRTEDHVLAARSRYVGGHGAWPEGDGRTRAEWLVRLARDEGLDGWVLIPTGEEEAALVARHHTALAGAYRVTTPAWAAFRDAYDKRRAAALAAHAGVERPWTLLPSSVADLDRAAGHFPVVVKPAFKETENPFTVAKAWRADDPETLRRRYADACALVEPDVVMVQELIPGDGGAQLAFAALCVDGQALASIAVRRTRQYPLDFGKATSHAESIADAALEESASRLLAAMRWNGVIEVEFKRGPDGVDRLLDLNPRFWGWHTLSIRAGVDFPYLVWRAACGLPVSPARARPGVRWVRMSTDLPAAVAALRARQLGLGGYVRSLRPPLEFAVYARDDPRPFLAGPFDGVRLLAQRARRPA